MSLEINVRDPQSFKVYSNDSRNVHAYTGHGAGATTAMRYAARCSTDVEARFHVRFVTEHVWRVVWLYIRVTEDAKCGSSSSLVFSFAFKTPIHAWKDSHSRRPHPQELKQTSKQRSYVRPSLADHFRIFPRFAQDGPRAASVRAPFYASSTLTVANRRVGFCVRCEDASIKRGPCIACSGAWNVRAYILSSLSMFAY